MISENAILPKVLAVLILATVPCRQVLASESGQHLLPAGPNLDTLPPYGKRYAEICERLLFPASSWIIRYFQIIGDPPYDTGLTIYRKADGSHWLMVRQARPEIGDIVVNAFYGRVDLQSSLASVKIEASNRQIPPDVALETHKLWLALLRKTRAKNKVDDTYYIHPPTVILWAKDRAGITLSGKYPPDAAKHGMFTAVEAIVDDLVKSCDAPDKDRIQVLRRVAERARHLRETLSRY